MMGEENRPKTPALWTKTLVAEIGLAVTGNTPSKKEKRNYGSHIPFVKPPQLIDGTIESAIEHLSETGAEKGRVAPINTVFVSCIGNLGKTGINRIPVAFNQQINAIFPSEGINPRFVFYQTQSGLFRKQLEEFSSATTISIVNKGNFEKLAFRLAPTNEQRRIVAKIEELFSELDKGVESLKTARAQLKTYRQAVLKHAFEGKLTANWREENKDKLEPAEKLIARIKQERQPRYQQQIEDWQQAVKDWEDGGKEGKKPAKPRKPTEPDKLSPSHIEKMWPEPNGWQWMQIGEFSFVTKLAGFEYTKHVQYDENGDLPVIKAENAGPNGYKVTDYSHVNSDTVSSLTRSHLHGGELLVVFVGAGTGNVATVPEDQQFFLGPNIGMVRPDTDSTITRFLELFLRSPAGKDMILATSKAVAQPSISMGTIRQTPVLLPSTVEQEIIIDILDSKLSFIDQTELSIEAQLKKSEALRQSILKKAFSGQLVPQDPNDEPASVLLERIRAEKEMQAKTKIKTKKKPKRKTAA